jgi:hypothetical protein
MARAELCRCVVVELRGFEPLTPCVHAIDAPGVRAAGRTSRDHTTAQVEGDAEDRAKGRREVTRGPVLANLWQGSPVAPESCGAAPEAQGPSQLGGDDG